MTTPTESDGFQTVTARKRFGAQYEDAGFRVWQELNTGASFYAMLAYKHGSAEDLQNVRDRLVKAIAIIDAALPDEATKVAALQAARAERRGEA